MVVLRTSKLRKVVPGKTCEAQHALQVTKHAHRHLSGARCLSRLVSSTLAESKKNKSHKKYPHRSSADPRRAAIIVGDEAAGEESLQWPEVRIFRAMAS